MASDPRYPALVRPLPLFALVLACASAPPKPEIIQDCPAAREAEKELAAKEGRPAKPIIQRGALLTDVMDSRNRPPITFAMATEAKGAPLRVQTRISVNAHGGVDSVEIIKSSGVASFDTAVVEKMKTWVHRPWVIDCHAVPYIYPMSFQHRFAR
jgi:TonB family protein